MNLEKLEKILEENNQPKFRLDQIKKSVYQDGVSSFSEISTLPNDLRELLDKEIKILSFDKERVLISKDGQSMKALLKLSDGNLIETVLLSPRSGNWTACISSQVGCPLKCEFCATGKNGFKRNLTAEEITDQVLLWKQILKENKIAGIFSNIVYMGMGEPFLNWEETRKSVEDLVNPKLFNFGSRSISISTAGIPEGIQKFLDEFPQVNLAISLHFADDEMRNRFMPINKQYNLESLRKILIKYFQKSKRKVFIEYIMFENLNDSLEDADKLINYLNSIGNSYLLHVNLISYNNPVIPSLSRNLIKLDPSTSLRSAQDDKFFKPSSKEKIMAFRDYLLKNKINATIRKSLGHDIQGACGQLAGK